MLKKFSSKLFGVNKLTALLLLGCLEFGIVAVSGLSVEADPKNAFLFGYSSSRLALFGLVLAVTLWLASMVWLGAYRSKVIHALEAAVRKAPLAAGFTTVLLAGLAIIILLTPVEFLGKFGFYFERLRAFLVVLCLYPAQFSMNWYRKVSLNSLQHSYGRLLLVSAGILAALAGFIVISGFGVIPEGGTWNPAGSPLTSFQASLILWLGLLLLGLFGILKPRLPVASGFIVDSFVIVGLVLVAINLWMAPPALRSEFSEKPITPYFQSFPSSDAIVHDLGALSTLNGTGIFFGKYTDKPLYMIFLAFLHWMGGNDYNELAGLHAGFMALMLPLLYVLGKTFTNRLFGFILAGTMLVRAYNSVTLANLLYFNVTPRQFMTEFPSLIGMAAFTLALFQWARSQENGRWRALLTGAVVGGVSLIRLNPFLLIIAVPVFMFFARRVQKRIWVTQMFTFLLGCVIVISPWMLTGKNSEGVPYFLLKFYDIVKVRYLSASSIPVADMPGLVSTTNNTDNPADQPVLSAGLNPELSRETFPGFVINNTLHNFVGAFLSLPDSFLISDQQAATLATRSYWTNGIESIQVTQIPFLLGNLILLALGLAWSWKRWKWAGLVPLFTFAVYSFSLGLARTSGSRYLVPVDWVANFYHLMGILWFVHIFPARFRTMLGFEPQEKSLVEAGTHNRPTSLAGRLAIGALIFSLAAASPLAGKIIPQNSSLCDPVDQKKLLPQLRKQGVKGVVHLVHGQVLYPEITADGMKFMFLTCRRDYSFQIVGVKEKFEVGQQILAGVRSGGPYPDLVMLAFPPAQGRGPEVVWKLP